MVERSVLDAPNYPETEYNRIYHVNLPLPEVYIIILSAANFLIENAIKFDRLTCFVVAGASVRPLPAQHRGLHPGEGVQLEESQNHSQAGPAD